MAGPGELRAGQFKPYKKAIALLLAKREWLEAVETAEAEALKTRAEGFAPVGKSKRRSNKPRYKESFYIESGIRVDRAGRRYVTTVWNDSPQAFYVEYGTVNNDIYAPLRKAAGTKA